MEKADDPRGTRLTKPALPPIPPGSPVPAAGALAGSSLKLDDSWGLAGEVGADIMVGANWFLNLSVRYIDIETDAKVNGDAFGKVNIDPWVYGAHIGFRF